MSYFRHIETQELEMRTLLCLYHNSSVETEDYILHKLNKHKVRLELKIEVKADNIPDLMFLDSEKEETNSFILTVKEPFRDFKNKDMIREDETYHSLAYSGLDVTLRVIILALLNLDHNVLRNLIPEDVKEKIYSYLYGGKE